ncbi:MAG: hypothetical protein LBU11_08025 [Zoogloeaceae bacterium]|jgi:hypothetical protein|nr:hypothetical protein [Zoogloeaceae bacterium]
MPLLRILIPLTAIAIVAGFFAYALTRDRRYLMFALRLLQIGLGLALVVFALLLLERLVLEAVLKNVK